jgi:hypothetical protein
MKVQAFLRRDPSVSTVAVVSNVGISALLMQSSWLHTQLEEGELHDMVIEGEVCSFYIEPLNLRVRYTQNGDDLIML